MDLVVLFYIYEHLSFALSPIKPRSNLKKKKHHFYH